MTATTAPVTVGLASRLLAFDPGFRGVRLATRATGSVVLAVFITRALAIWVGQPITLVIIAGALAMFSTLAVNDPGRRAQMVTMALAPVPAAGAFTLGVALAPWPLIADPVFVGVIFVAVWVRRFGPRGFAFGMLGFLPYFFALFLKPAPAALPWFYLSILIGLGSASLIRFVILPERPRRMLPRMLRSFFALTDGVLAMAEGLAGQRETASRPRRRMRRRLTQLNATALDIELLLDTVDTDTRRSFGVSPFALFEFELAIEQVAVEIADIAPEHRRRARRSLRILRHAIRHRAAPPDATLAGWNDGDGMAEDGGLCGLAAETGRLFGDQPVSGERPRFTDRGAAGKADRAEGGREPPAGLFTPSGWRRLLRRTLDDAVTRQAIQAAVAGAAAIAAGQLVSPQRWYWAAITAFIVFTGTESRGEVMLKGGQRVLGTLGGVAAGVGLAALLDGHTRLQVALIFACVYVAAFFLRRSYAVMIFAITVLVAMLYALLGFFSAELLELRIIETVIGAAVGMGVAAVLLPTSTRRRVRDASIDVLAALADLIEACGEEGDVVERRVMLTGRSRTLDSRVQTLWTLAQPLLRTTTGFLSRKGARRWLRALWACRHYSRTLVRLSRDPAWFASNEWRLATATVSDKFRLLAGRLPNDRNVDPAARVPMPEIRRSGAPGHDANEDGIIALQRLDRIATRLLDAQGGRWVRYTGL